MTFGSVDSLLRFRCQLAAGSGIWVYRLSLLGRWLRLGSRRRWLRLLGHDNAYAKANQ